MDKEKNEKLDKEENKPDGEVMKSRIEEVMSRIFSDKYDANIKIKFVSKDEKDAKDKK